MEIAFYKTFLKTELQRRCQNNSSYSLRAFGRFLDVDVGLLSRVLANKGSIGLKTARKISEKLELNEKVETLFFTSILQEKSKIWTSAKPSPKAKNLDQEAFRAITDWYHQAILEMTATKKFTSSSTYISKRLGIGAMEAKFAVERLLKLGLLEVHHGKYRKTNQLVQVSNPTITSKALKLSHKQLLEKGITSLEKDPIEKRVFQGCTMAIDPKLLPIAREMIGDFLQNLCSVLESKDQEKVYHLEVGLFPLEKDLS